MADEFDADAAVRSYLNGSAPTPETALRASLQDTVGKNPDQVADWRRTAATIGVPLDTAEAMPDWSKQQKALADIDTSALARMNPVTTSFLSDPGNAAIAHDDTGNMGLIETLANSFRRGVPGLQQVIGATALRSNVNALEQFEAVEARLAAGEKPGAIRAADDPMGVAYMTPEQRERFKASITTPIGGNIATIARTQKERQAIPQPEVVGQVLDAKTFGAAFNAFLSAPVQFIASIGPESMVTNAPGLIAAIPAGMAAGPGGAAAVMGAGSFATDYGSSIVEALTKAGVDVSNQDALAVAVQDPDLMRSVAAQAFAHAAVVGTVDAASGGAASKLLLPAKALAARPLTRELANVGVQVPVQGVMGGVGELGGEIAAGQEIQPGNILAEIVGEAFTAPAEIGSIAGKRVLERMADARAAAGAATRVEQLAVLVEESKLRERAPDAFKAFVDQVAQGGETPTELYINAETLANTLNQSGITMAELQALAPSVAEQMQAENFVPGSDLRIPIAELLAAPTDITTALIDHLRDGPDAMSRAEASQYLEGQGDAIKAEVEQELARQDNRAAFQQQVEQVRDQFQAQLDAAGKFRPEVNKAYATMLGNFYAVQAFRAGVTPQELMQRYGLNVSAVEAQGRQRLDQGEPAMLPAPDDPDIAQLAPEAQATMHALYAQAAREKPAFDASLQQLADDVGATLKTGNIKGTARAVAKVVADYGGDPTKIKDLLRATLSVDSAETAQRAIAGIFENFEVLPAGRRNLLDPSKTPEDGYRDAKFNVLVNGHVAEIQVNVPEMLRAKKEGGHKLYEERAALQREIEGDMLDDRVTEKLKRVGELNRQMRELYDAAWAATNARNSSAESGAPLRRADSESNLRGGLESQAAETGSPLTAPQETGMPSTSKNSADGSNSAGSSDTTDSRFIGTSDPILRVNQGDRGALSFGSDITQAPSVIALLKNADLSTFIHESGHFFLEVQADLAARIAGRIADGDTVLPGEQQIAADMDTLLRFFGVTGTPDQTPLATWLSMSLEEKREHHETFARGFERYAMEGVAPSQELAQLFQRFRSWLISVYRTLAGLNVTLTDDVRAVMDRMLATDAAIQEAQDARNMGPLFQTPEQAGMTPEEYAEYQGLGQRATDTADAELDARLLKDLKWMAGAKNKALKARQKEVAALRLEVRTEVSREVMSQPLYRAWQFLTGKADKVAPGTVAPEDIDTVQESGRLRTSLVKAMDEFSAETLQRRRMTAEKDGMHPDIVAELFGYESGQQLVAALAAAETPNQVIDQLTDQRMLERHGDITSPAALERAAEEAIHNQVRARVIATELKALAKATTVRESSDSLYTPGTVDVMARAAREYAEQVVARLKIKDVRPKQYAAAEARSAKLAEQALGGDLQEAAMHKRNQLVNNFATRAAYDAQDEITAANEFFKKVIGRDIKKIGERRDVGTVQAARAILAEYGIGTKGEPAQKYLETMAQDDPGMFAVLREKVDAMTANAKPVAELTVEEFRGLVEEIKGLWHQARRARQMEVDGQMLEIEKVKGDLVGRMVEIGIPERVAGEGMAVTDSERRLAKLRTLGAALRRVEAWVGVKDGTATMGPFRKFVWQPVKEAADRYRADKAKYVKRYRELLEALDLGQGRIAAPELGYTFGFSRGGSGKAEILHAILHTGNESNKRKLLLGRGWAVENEVTGELDTRKWDAFVTRMIDQGVLTKADFDFAQGVWNLLEDTKALAQKAHRDVFGRYFDEVTADSFTNKFGTYAGGYVPAMTDAEVVKDAATRSLQEDENQTLAYAFPSTLKGFTKKRVEYNKPLLLDLRSLSSHIDKVLLFSHMEQPIRDVRKVLASRDVSEPLHRIDPQAFDGLLTPWLNRAARQTVETKVPGDNGMLRVFSKLRQRAGLAAMFANVSNTAQQITGFSLAALKVRPKYLIEALAQSIIAPRQTARAVAEASSYMATRMDNEVAAMTDAIDQILMNPNVYEKAQNWTAKHAYFMQSAIDNFMSPIVWNGAYNQALEQGSGERDAIRLADAAVRQTQGSTLAEDVSRIETGNPFVRMFTQFAGYFNMQANLLGTEFSRTYHELGLRKGMGRGLYLFVFGFLVPNMMAELIAQAFKGGPDDEDKDGSTLDDWLRSVLIMGNVRAALAMVPGIGQAANATINTFNSKPYDDRISTSPAVSMVESAVKAPVEIYKAATGQGSARAAVRDLATLITLTTGLPATAIARPLGYMAGVSENRIAPTGPMDNARGLVTGTPSPESKQ